MFRSRRPLGRGEWDFCFRYDKRETFSVRRYQPLLLELRKTFEPKYAEMASTEGEAEWTIETDGKAPLDNIFAKFSYKCTRPHADQGSDHGTWYLLWDPKKAIIEHHLNARCAPTRFKELSHEIQKKLCEEYPDHFELTWENGLSGYDEKSKFGGAVGYFGFGLSSVPPPRRGSNTALFHSGSIGYGGRGGMRRTPTYHDALRTMQALSDMQQEGDHQDGSRNYCPHNRAREFCGSCNGGGGW